MQRAAKKTSPGRIVSLALTWDGARWPTRSLPAKAQAFLSAGSTTLPSPSKMGALLAAGDPKEIRICWVPRLKGGKAVLSDPFRTPTGKRLAYRPVKTTPFGDTLGVIYRR